MFNKRLWHNDIDVTNAENTHDQVPPSKLRLHTASGNPQEAVLAMAVKYMKTTFLTVFACKLIMV